MTGSSEAERNHIWRFRYQGPRNGTGYTFCPLRGGLAVENAEQIFIYDEDFTEPIQIIKRQYPLDEEYAGKAMKLLTLAGIIRFLRTSGFAFLRSWNLFIPMIPKPRASYVPL